MYEEPYIFSTITSEFTHSTGLLNVLMMPILVILSSSDWNFFFNAKEIFLGRLIAKRIEILRII